MPVTRPRSPSTPATLLQTPAPRDRSRSPESRRRQRLLNDVLELSVISQARQALAEAGQELGPDLEVIYRDRVEGVLNGDGWAR